MEMRIIEALSRRMYIFLASHLAIQMIIVVTLLKFIITFTGSFKIL